MPTTTAHLTLDPSETTQTITILTGVPHDVIVDPGETVEVPAAVAEHFVNGEPYRWTSPEFKPATPGSGYASMNRTDLDAELANRELEPPTTGSGANGRVVNADLVAVLEANDVGALPPVGTTETESIAPTPTVVPPDDAAAAESDTPTDEDAAGE